MHQCSPPKMEQLSWGGVHKGDAFLSGCAENVERCREISCVAFCHAPAEWDSCLMSYIKPRPGSLRQPSTEQTAWSLRHKADVSIKFPSQNDSHVTRKISTMIMQICPSLTDVTSFMQMLQKNVAAVLFVQNSL